MRFFRIPLPLLLIGAPFFLLALSLIFFCRFVFYPLGYLIAWWIPCRIIDAIRAHQTEEIAPARVAIAPPQYSDDGFWYWNGFEWVESQFHPFKPVRSKINPSKCKNCGAPVTSDRCAYCKGYAYAS